MSFFCFALAVLFIACACLRSVKTDVFLLLPTMIVCSDTGYSDKYFLQKK